MQERISNRHGQIPTQVGVVGGGQMGSGIAHAFLVAGSLKVIVVEIDHTAAQQAIERICGALQKSLDRGHISREIHEWSTRLATSTDYSALSDCELVIEAVPEAWDIKVSSLLQAESNLNEDSWLATNTSSMSIRSLSKQLERPDRFCGLHFFNPVPASKLVEIVLAPCTSSEMEDKSRSWVEALGKTPIVLNDSPGFASSRLGLAIGLEAIRMVQEDVATPEDIDNAMVLGYKFPIGPLALTDIVGLDVRLGIAEYLHSTLGDRFEPPRLLREMVDRGELGRKSGRGFYTYK
ncbi:3-hydroxyacyl-CoA dehydrogenase family protein [Auritidibacter ignavus]|uniref:3-hydroxyacyl-CoA dehydrogenase family protein n=1 Tax=Auritidibacter ignavus TaxID=678932 RepID=UPI00109CDD4A|nr:3-hydroxyacyl-CoA dehydrogenase family protein [Auritidibacter ignavus]